MKTLFFALVALFALALTAVAVPPPEAFHWPDGWGTCSNEIIYEEPWESPELIWDFEGNQWVNCDGDAYTEWPDLIIELWVEMECIFEWDETEVDIHRTSNYDDFCVSFDGNSRCNSPVRIYVVPNGADLGHLTFWGDGFGNFTNSAYNIPLSWAVRVDGDGWFDLIPDPGFAFCIDRCNHYWELRCCLDMAYHQPDGFYAFVNEIEESPVLLTAFPCLHL